MVLRLRLVLILSLTPCLLLGLGGCERVHYHVASAHPITAAAEVGRPIDVTQHFSDEARRWSLFWGTWAVGGADGNDLLLAFADKGDGIVNLRMQEGFRGPDVLLGLLTAGIVSARWHGAEGDIFVYRPAAGKIAMRTAVGSPVQ